MFGDSDPQAPLLNLEKNECTAPAVGIETGEILDSQLSASSGDPSNARLNGAKTWCRTWPGSESENVYVQVTKERIPFCRRLSVYQI